jgi:hypothetical protein
VRRTAAAIVVTALLVGLVAFAAAPANAADAPTPSARVTLLEQPAYATLGADVPLRLAVTGPVEGLEARAIVHASMTSRTGFERSIDGDRLGSTVATVGAPAATLPFSPDGGRVLDLALQDPNAPRDPNRLRLPMPRSSNTGVFPVEIELRDPESGERVSSFVTHLVASTPRAEGEPMSEPLNVSWVWPIADDPANDPAGRIRPEFVQSVHPGGRLTRLATAASRSPNVPLTLEPGPETVESWSIRARNDASAAPGLDLLRSATSGNQILSGPYVPIDLPSLEQADLGNDGSIELTKGAETLETVLDTRIDTGTAEPAPLNQKALGRLALAQVDQLVLAPDQLQEPEQAPELTPARPFKVRGDVRQFSAVQTDEGLEHLLEGTEPPALRAAHFLAGLSIVAIEAPNTRRGVVVTMPPRWNPDTALLNAVLRGLADNPLLHPVTVDQLFDRVPAATDDNDASVTRELAPITVSAPTVNPRRYKTTHSNLEAFASIVGKDDPRIAAGNRALLISLTSTWSGVRGREESRGRLDGVNAMIGRFTSLIETPPNGVTVTLTSRKSELPLSFNNRTGQDVRVRIKFDSAKLVFTNGAQQTFTLKPRNNTIRFPVETRTSGTFPLNIAVTSEDGRLPLSSARYTVRSTVISGVGIFLTIGAGLFLAVWWITHWRRSRRRPVRPATVTT